MLVPEMGGREYWRSSGKWRPLEGNGQRSNTYDFCSTGVEANSGVKGRSRRPLRSYWTTLGER